MNTLNDQIAFFVYQKQYEILRELYAKFQHHYSLLGYECIKKMDNKDYQWYDYEYFNKLFDEQRDLTIKVFSVRPFITNEFFEGFSKILNTFYDFRNAFKENEYEKIVANTGIMDMKFGELRDQIYAFVHKNHGHKE